MSCGTLRLIRPLLTAFKLAGGEPGNVARGLRSYIRTGYPPIRLSYRVITLPSIMQLFPEFNKQMAGRSFDADAFTLVLHLGASAFCKLVGASNLCFKRGKGARATFVRMDLQPNEGGFDRLKIHFQADEKVHMDFYMLTPMPGGMKPLKGAVTVVQDVELEYMFEVFKEVTGFNLEGDEPETV